MSENLIHYSRYWYSWHRFKTPLLLNSSPINFQHPFIASMTAALSKRFSLQKTQIQISAMAHKKVVQALCRGELETYGHRKVASPLIRPSS